MVVQITFDAHDPAALAQFWAEVLGYIIPGPPGPDVAGPGATGPDATGPAAGPVAAETLAAETATPVDAFAAWRVFLDGIGVPEAEWNSRAAAEDPAGVGPRLYFQRVPESKAAKNRVHLDVRTAPHLDGPERMAALEAECTRLLALGATQLERFDPVPPLDRGHLVMADPEGNEFCLD